MRALIVDRYGLRAGDVAEPKPCAEEVLIQVHAAGANLVESKGRSGELKLILLYRTPAVRGQNVAGVVVRAEPQVHQFAAGDEVYARPDDLLINTMAKSVAVREASVAFKPTNVTTEEAASIPMGGLTGWQALVEMARVSKGQNAFIRAGSVGVGALEPRRNSYTLGLKSQDCPTLKKSPGVLKPGGQLSRCQGCPLPSSPKLSRFRGWSGRSRACSAAASAARSGAAGSATPSCS